MFALTWKSLWEQVHALPVSLFVREWAWAYPVLETFHVLGLGLLFGCIVVFDLRVITGKGRIAVANLGALLLPWVWIGFIINATSGALLFASDAVEFAANTAFRAKMALILIAGANALAFQWRYGTSFSDWDNANVIPASARIMAIISIVVWISVLTAGRMIAYID